MDEQWFYGENGQQRGPISLAALRDRITAGLTRGDDLVWREGLSEWTPAANLPELNVGLPPGNVPPPGPAAAPITPHMQAGYTPGYAPYDYDAMRGNRAATTALTCGILSIVFAFCCPLVGVGLGIAAVINGKTAQRFTGNQGGFVCGIVGLALSVLSMIGGVALQFVK